MAHLFHCQAASIQQRGADITNFECLLTAPRQTGREKRRAMKDHLTLSFSVNLRERNQARKCRYQFPVSRGKGQTRGNGQDNQLQPDLPVTIHASELKRTVVWRTQLLPGSQASSSLAQTSPHSSYSTKGGNGDRRTSGAIVRLSWTPTPRRGLKLQPGKYVKTRQQQGTQV